MNIISYLQSRGIDTVDSSFYRRIEEWQSWYKGRVKGFSFYRVYSGQGTYNKRRRKSLGMAKKVSEDIADLLLNEKVVITIDDTATDEFVQNVLKRNRFLVVGNDYQERKAYTGTAAYIPFLDNMEIDEAGNVHSGEISINYVSGLGIYPVSWHNGIVTECAFAFTKTVNRKKYVHIQLHVLEAGKYVIENAVLECQSGSKEGKELRPEEWRQLKPFENLAQKIYTDSSEPQYVIDRLNIVNNADDDESNPMGIAIYANAIDVLKKLDTEYDSYSNEFELGRKRIFVAPEMVTYKDGSPAFDPEDTVFYKFPDDYKGNDGKEGMIHEVDMTIRADEHSKAINDDLNYLSLKCGFGTDRYQFEAGNVKTATEVISENSDMFRMIKKHEIILEDVLKELIRIIVRLGIVLNVPLNPDAEIIIEFDDSIIEDKAAERSTDRQDVAMGAMPLYEYREKWYGETEEVAKTKVQTPGQGIVE